MEKNELIEALSIDTGMSIEIIEREISILQNSNTERGDPLNLLKGLGLRFPKQDFTNRFKRRLNTKNKSQ